MIATMLSQYEYVLISYEDTCDTISSAVSEPVNQEEDSFEFEQEDYTSDTYEEEEEYEDESDVEMDNDEDSSLESISELNLIHRFIIISVALFVSLYVVDEGAVILIAIISKILQFLFDPFRLPVSVAGLKLLAGFEALISGVKKYVVCSECHVIYDNEAAPLCCTSPNFDKTFLCGNSLFKSGPRSKTPKKTYVFHSVKKALKTFFQCPDFENKINSWNRGPKMDSTLFDVYDSAMWNEIVDVDGIPLVDQ
ncbi:hypothetical protein PHYBLDRAFT_63529 [Phycomyces blakesleeanus NRRL 1555(-)]|uniref:Uncharacterized protein n=1 Tax=Phycomyces blakesleeanus (strain ATCC 8743b / DSM 1359 / FGSC 10004 / NBRC 33097 / NRRL 1555) TaxID=763407 RepID=A0A167KP74_PHYB8|nr:hypothetical protein PHYBLDRAFT_63529 [Phycomyces blakesleeanus NRRL 1555(-)]OAD68556.1 hypothetical protein PHYBLDRAFT_63529 [Phycomyces blakesleeanus NRRL 1555(-)]|eukprot:XP_018286596.1 hypothetical protein PHYBLDRAFT_63529 [Phycomyces blakesleeanus NRRL 1555(-)]